MNSDVSKISPANAAKNQTGTSFPRAILSVSREELDNVPLTIRKGLTAEETSLPDDLLGHLFVIAPAGTLDSPQIEESNDVRRPSANGWTPLFNGDGMVYRCDFEAGQARLTNSLVKTPCYYADLATHRLQTKLKFRNLGFGRISLGASGFALGIRNQINTAFVPFKFENDGQRLLVTWDTGRPFEIDPRSLRLIAPVGKNEQWKSLISLPIANPPFKQMVSSAHPCFDPNNGGEMYTVNLGKSLSTVLWLSRSVYPLLLGMLKFLRSLSNRWFVKAIALFFKLGIWLFELADIIFEKLFHHDFVYLLRWHGLDVNDLERWELVLENGKPIKITETLHQMGITEDYIVLADTSFKFDLEEVFPYSATAGIEDLEAFAIEEFDFSETPYTELYIVRRDDLSKDKQQVKVKKIRIPLALAHYLVDYENPDGKITLHTEHMCATDPSETLRHTDRSVFADPKIDFDLMQLAGTVGGPMDLSRLGCHVIDVANGKVTSSYAQDPEYTWSTAFYAYRRDLPVKKFEDIYWNSWGCWTDTLSEHIYNLYKDYEPRTIKLEDVLKLTRQGIPASVCRLHINRNEDPIKLELQDRYLFPHNYLGTSAQFIPKANTTGTTEGYIACMVVHSNHFISESEEDPNWSRNSEIWILDAADLAAGPLYRLSHAKFNLGFTLHTTWLENLGDGNVDRSYNIADDYNGIIERQSLAVRTQIQELFDKEVYPNFQGNPKPPTNVN